MVDQRLLVDAEEVGTTVAAEGSLSSLVAAGQAIVVVENLASAAVSARSLVFHVAAGDAGTRVAVAHEESVLEVPAAERNDADVVDERVG